MADSSKRAGKILKILKEMESGSFKFREFQAHSYNFKQFFVENHISSAPCHSFMLLALLLYEITVCDSTGTMAYCGISKLR